MRIFALRASTVVPARCCATLGTPVILHFANRFAKSKLILWGIFWHKLCPRAILLGKEDKSLPSNQFHVCCKCCLCCIISNSTWYNFFSSNHSSCPYPKKSTFFWEPIQVNKIYFWNRHWMLTIFGIIVRDRADRSGYSNHQFQMNDSAQKIILALFGTLIAPRGQFFWTVKKTVDRWWFSY